MKFTSCFTYEWVMEGQQFILLLKREENPECEMLIKAFKFDDNMVEEGKWVCFIEEECHYNAYMGSKSRLYRLIVRWFYIVYGTANNDDSIVN